MDVLSALCFIAGAFALLSGAFCTWTGIEYGDASSTSMGVIAMLVGVLTIFVGFL